MIAPSPTHSFTQVLCVALVKMLTFASPLCCSFKHGSLWRETFYLSVHMRLSNLLITATNTCSCHGRQLEGVTSAVGCVCPLNLFPILVSGNTCCMIPMACASSPKYTSSSLQPVERPTVIIPLLQNTCAARRNHYTHLNLTCTRCCLQHVCRCSVLNSALDSVNYFLAVAYT